ncbi:hypothetical protein ACSFA2_03640 [Variovorax sp. LT2P21]|uniref:hypothetical protein n=1 Tax=Variovorax sp. LT2P21 TaxID=3443731 RepID=UPI003F472FA5
MELNVFDIGPMVDGISVDLGRLPDAEGNDYLVLLQYGGLVCSSCTSAGIVNSVWAKSPPSPPDRQPIVTLMPLGGGPRATFAAAGIVENARCGLGLLMCNLRGVGDVTTFLAADIRHLAARVEQDIPDVVGGFVVRWEPAIDDGLPF